ncbi:MAG: hypothetical protein DMG65_14200 [Candidatus Angelobacter sp. Gp1-AA117]|nr:MAG: hypothetical protein DMG65_14200 [Candidatus Angelobacter sp. Gp1-AA117]
MKSLSRERLFLSLVVLILTAVLVTLAVHQYHWSNVVSQATSARLQANLHDSVISWREGLYRELTGVYASLQANPDLPAQEKARIYAEEYAQWNRRTPHPDLVSRLYFLSNAGTGQQKLVQLNAASAEIAPAEWPERLGDLRAALQSFSAEMNQASKIHNRIRPMPEHARMHRRFMGFMGTDGSVPSIDLNNLVLVRSFVSHRPEAGQPSNVDWLIIELNKKVLLDHILPELAEQHFSDSQGLAYQVAVTDTSSDSGLIYSSDSDFGRQKIVNADQQVQVFGPPFGMPPRRGFDSMPAFLRHPGGPPNPSHEHNELGLSGPLRVELLHDSDHDPEWQLSVRHRKGSLEAVVTGMRRKNLVISFAVLLILAASMGMIIVTSQRARTLARQQMDFVAAVSHELRTPVAVISSAAENIADGIVSSRQQLMQYGNVIKGQSKQLIQLIEQILLFAATRDKQPRYDLRPMEVSDLVENALNNTGALLQGEGFIIEKQIEPNLPQVMGDLRALSHCLQNLITNAVKYSGGNRWVGVRAFTSTERKNGEVQIVIEDKGLGIESRELHRIFEPFYRSPRVTSAQIRGTGLGLALARSIAEAMGGKLTVTSEPGRGSAFSLHLPIPPKSVENVNLDVPATANPKYS